MSLRDHALLRIALYQGPGAETLDPSEKFEILSRLLDEGFVVNLIEADLDPNLPSSEPLLILARFSNGAPPTNFMVQREGQTRFQNIADLKPEKILEQVEEARRTADAADARQWKPWFPVIDYDRCTNCMQCLSFCLFGVYGVDEEQSIQVQNNDQCKTNCPACSRVCPEAAIMFPKYRSGPINGEEVSESDLNREKMKVDISALLGGDIYDLLKQRSVKAKSRFSKERDEDKALNERQKCLVKLRESVDIPAEVLMSLPSMDEIHKRSQEAAAKAQTALENAKSRAPDD